jgi:urease accessory protein
MDEPLPATDLGFVAIFGIMAANNGIEPEDTLTGYAWSWCENQVLSAVKLVPLGHLAGQRLLRCLGDQLIDVVAGAMDCVDENVGMTAHGLVLASARHETQYTRLFRS